MAIEDWGRGHFEEGGGDAFVAFWVFGDLGKELEISAERHRVTGMPEGLQIGRKSRGTPDGDEALRGFTTDAFALTLDEDPQLARAVRASASITQVTGNVGEQDDLLYLRSTIGIIQAMFEAGAVGVVDAALNWWSPARWKAEVFDPDRPSYAAFVSVLGSEDERNPGFSWIHTRGMRLFGRPDLSVRRVTEEMQPAVADLVMRLVNMQAMGGIVPDGQPVKMKGIPAGWTCKRAGDVEDPEFNNVHLAIGPG